MGPDSKCSINVGWHNLSGKGHGERLGWRDDMSWKGGIQGTLNAEFGNEQRKTWDIDLCKLWESGYPLEKRSWRGNSVLIMPVDEVPREERGIETEEGQGVCGFTSASKLVPSLHLLPKTSRIHFQLDLCLCLHSIPRPQWTLPGSPLWAVVFGTYHFKEGVRPLCQCIRESLFIILLDYCHYLYIDTIVGVCKLSDFVFYPF